MDSTAPAGTSWPARTPAQKGLPTVPGIDLAIEDGPEDVDLAGPGVSMLSQVGVEAERLVVPALGQPCLSEEVHRENGRMATVTAPERYALPAEVRKLPDPTPLADDYLRPPLEVGVSHRQRPALSLAEMLTLQVGKVGVPGDVDSPGQKRGHLCLVAQV